MPNIVGTITTIQNFLSKKEVKFTVDPDTPDTRTIVLSENRKYIIPAYQREIRWNSGNLNVLLSDLANGPKFLGNIILSLKSNDECEIIDGQQRTTILQMIIACIRCKYNDEIELFEMSEIDNKSFSGLSILIENSFDESRLNVDTIEEIRKSDKYSQCKRIKELWSILNRSQIICDRYRASALISNIKTSEVNIIASKADSEDVSIRYFLDVNLKGVRLDKEDIFKGYLFGQDSRPETKALWQENKRLDIQLNEMKRGKEDKHYPLMKLYEHFFYCDLYLPKENGQDFSGVSFGEDFCLSQTAEMQTRKFYEGTHIIEVIQNSRYLQDSLKRIKQSLLVMIDIAGTEGPSDFFKSLFHLNDSKKLDSVDISNIHCILKKIILDKEIVPKVLALKYIITFFDGKEYSKNDYRSAYTVFAAATLFIIFANKKESVKFYAFVKNENWIANIIQWLSRYVNSYELTRGKVLAAYAFSEGTEESIEEQIRSKSLAAVFNCFSINSTESGQKQLQVDVKRFNEFLTNKTNYSIEHFIIAKSGSLKVKTTKFEFVYEYSSAVKRYRNSLFNYIFIPDTINGELQNELLFKKTKGLQANLGKVTCKYSKKYIELLVGGSYFVEYPTNAKLDEFETEEGAKDYLNKYFANTFPSELLDFASALTRVFDFAQ